MKEEEMEKEAYDYRAFDLEAAVVNREVLRRGTVGGSVVSKAGRTGDGTEYVARARVEEQFSYVRTDGVTPGFYSVSVLGADVVDVGGPLGYISFLVHGHYMMRLNQFSKLGRGI